jgi:peptidoglycan hydrolase CwlO-like protein
MADQMQNYLIGKTNKHDEEIAELKKQITDLTARIKELEKAA